MFRLAKTIEYLFCLFIFLLPWQTRLIWQEADLNGAVWEYGRFSLYGTEILLWLILFLYGAWLIFSGWFKKISAAEFFSRLKNPAYLVYWLLVAFLLLAGLSISWSLDPQLAYLRWFVLIEAGALMSLVLVFNLSLQRIGIAWVAAAVGQSVFAVSQFFLQYTFANKWLGLAEHRPAAFGSIVLETQSERWLRAYGSLPHPNILAGFLVIALLFLFWLAFLAKTRGQRIFILTALAAIAPALFFTFSRSAWLALVFCLLLLYFWLEKRKEQYLKPVFFKMVFLTSLIFIILATLLWPLVFTRLAGQRRLEDASISQRLAYTDQALTLIKGDWLSGQGIGNYTLAVYQKINAAWPGYAYQPVHNLYLLVLAELGIFGAAVFGLALFLLFISFNRVISWEKVIAFLCLFAVLFISLFDHYFWTLYFGVMVFWLVLGLSLKKIKEN